MATILKGSALFEEVNHGAHYYAYSPTLSTSQYTEVFANIVLPTSFQNIPVGSGYQYTRRHAFISLGINGYISDCGTTVGVDAGITNRGSGWMPYYHDVASTIPGKTDFSAIYPDYTAGSTATNAIIVVKPISNSSIGLYVRFVNSTGMTLVTFNDTLSVNERDSWSQYYRFASLVPNAENVPDVRTDSTYMTGGKFINLGIYNAYQSAYYDWGIPATSPAELVENAWIMYSPRCQVTTTNNSDAFKIDHYYGNPLPA